MQQLSLDRLRLIELALLLQFLDIHLQLLNLISGVIHSPDFLLIHDHFMNRDAFDDVLLEGVVRFGSEEASEFFDGVEFEAEHGVGAATHEGEEGGRADFTGEDVEGAQFFHDDFEEVVGEVEVGEFF